MLVALPARRVYAAMAWFVIGWAAMSRGCLAKGCSEMGCQDGLGAKLRTADGAWPPGEYELVFRADAIEAICKFRLPDQLPTAPGAATGLDCGPDVHFSISFESECETGCDGNACWQGCRPIPGKFDMHGGLRHTPARVELSLIRDGQGILAEDVKPAYSDFFPNGPHCGGSCRQATLEFAVR